MSAGQRRDATKRAPTASERIVEAARALFVEAGETAVTMRAVAARAKVSPMAAYRHFESREALMHAVMERGHDDFLRRMHHALAAPGPGERLAATGRAYLDFALENPRDYALMFMQSVAGDPCAGAPAWRDAATFRFLVDRIAECTAAGLMPPGDPELLALSLWAHIHGLVSLYLAQKLALDEAAFRALCDRVLTMAWRPEATFPPDAAGIA